jgi:hypothetical protein
MPTEAREDRGAMSRRLRLPASMDSVEDLSRMVFFKRRLVPSVRELLLKESSKSLPM